MANHRSAEKRARQALTRRARNRSTLSAVRTAIKKVETAVEAKDKTAATEALAAATSLIGRAAAKRVLHPNTAGRRVSRLTLQVNGLG
jgi:small subunit ribosomal protein S20